MLFVPECLKIAHTKKKSLSQFPLNQGNVIKLLLSNQHLKTKDVKFINSVVLVFTKPNCGKAGTRDYLAFA